MNKSGRPEPISTITEGTPPWRPTWNWRSIAEQLKAKPNTWFLIFEQGPASRVNAIREGRITHLDPQLGFVYKTYNNRREVPRTCDLWMMYDPDRADPVAEALRENRKN